MDNQHKIESLKEMMLNMGFDKVEVVDIKFLNIPYYRIRYTKNKTISGSFDISQSLFSKVENQIIIKELKYEDKRLWEK